MVACDLGKLFGDGDDKNRDVYGNWPDPCAVGNGATLRSSFPNGINLPLCEGIATSVIVSQFGGMKEITSNH